MKEGGDEPPSFYLAVTVGFVRIFCGQSLLLSAVEVIM